MAAILTLRYNYAPDSRLRRSQVVASVKDSPVRIRKPLYASPDEKKYKIPRRLHPLKVFCSSQALAAPRPRAGLRRTAGAGGRDPQGARRPARRRTPPRPELRRGADPRGARHRLRQLRPRLLPGAARGGDGLPLRLPDPPGRPAALRPSGPTCRLLLHRHLHPPEQGRLQGGPGGRERGALGGLGDRGGRAPGLQPLPALRATTPSATPTAASATSATAPSPPSTSGPSSTARSRSSTSTTTTATAPRTSSGSGPTC